MAKKEEKTTKKTGKAKGTKKNSKAKGTKKTGKSTDKTVAKSNKRSKNDTIVKSETMIRRFTTSLRLDKNPGIVERTAFLFKKWGKSLKIGGATIHNKDIYLDSDRFEHLRNIDKQKDILRKRLENRDITPSVFDMELNAIELSIDDVQVNMHKDDHIHIMMDFGRGSHALSDICKYLSDEENGIIVPENMIQFITAKKGQLHKNILGALAYLTHNTTQAQADGKFVYDASEVLHFKFDATNKSDYSDKIHELGKIDTYSDFLKIYEELRKEYDTVGRDYVSEILKGDLLPDEVVMIDPDYYFTSSNASKLERARKYYVNNVLPAPTLRTSFYIGPDKGLEQTGRIGKTMLAKGIALSQCALINSTLFADLKAKSDNEIDLFTKLQEKKMIFQVGGSGVSFDGYDGEPIIFFDDIRPDNLMKIFKTRDSLLTYFDPPYTKSALNIKYGTVILKNVVNIVNGYNNFDDFVKDLSISTYKYDDGTGVKTYHANEDERQLRGRLPYRFSVSSTTVTAESQLEYLINTSEYDIKRRFPNRLRLASQNKQLSNFGDKMLADYNEQKPIIEEHYRNKNDDDVIDITFDEITDENLIEYNRLYDFGYSTYTYKDWTDFVIYLKKFDESSQASPYEDDDEWEKAYNPKLKYAMTITDDKLVTKLNEMRRYLIHRYLTLHYRDLDLPVVKLKNKDRNDFLIFASDIATKEQHQAMHRLMSLMRAEFRKFYELATTYDENK